MKKALVIIMAICFVAAFFELQAWAQTQQQQQKAASQQKTQATAAQKVNINKASKDEVAKLPDIGPKTAEEIIKYREKNGPFKKIEDIKKVQGIGEKKFEKIKDLITVE